MDTDCVGKPIDLIKLIIKSFDKINDWHLLFRAANHKAYVRFDKLVLIFLNCDLLNTYFRCLAHFHKFTAELFYN